MSAAEKTAKELAQLLDELDDESLASLPEKEILELRKQLNPYGRTIEGSDKVLTFSYTDLQAEYQKKLLVTSMVGFLNRMLDEWRVNPGIPVTPVYDYVRNPKVLDEFEKTLQDPELMRAELDEHRELMQKKVFVKEFLEDMFQYNPDLHVRSAYAPNPQDDERTILDTPAANLAIARLKHKDPSFKEQLLQYERLQLIKKKKEKSKEKSEENEKQDEKFVSLLEKTATEMIPPADIFHRWQYYYDTNFEELQHITNNLYTCKPEFTTAVNPYAWHDNEDDADNFIDKHRDEVISTIFKAHSGKWNIIAPFKKVRESMRFFNKDTKVLEGIANQIEKDSKMGKQLMEKRSKIQKKKNEEKEGPDSEAFKKWRAQNNTLKDMGAINPNDESDDDLPDNALEVPVFRVSGGGTSVVRDKFYTEAVAPDDVGPCDPVTQKTKLQVE
jgi:hypothetical protein